MSINHTDMDYLIWTALGIAAGEFARRRDRALSEMQHDNFFVEMRQTNIDYAQFCERRRALYEQAYEAWQEMAWSEISAEKTQPKKP
jgi:hypothetical protein